MATFSRRKVLGAGGALIGAAAVGTTMAAAAGADTGGEAIRTGDLVPEEVNSLDRLYAEARREGGKLVIYAGGRHRRPTRRDEAGVLVEVPRDRSHSDR